MDKTQRAILINIRDITWLKIENTYLYTSNHFENVVDIMMESGKNVSYCYDSAIMNVDSATIKADSESNRCFKKQTDEFQISVLSAFSVKIFKNSIF